MIKLKMIGVILLIAALVSGCASVTTSNMPPPPGAGSVAEDNEEITENIDSIIESMIAELGEPPEDVIGFGAGYKRRTAITTIENAALLNLYRKESSHFAYYDMACVPSVTLDDMLTYSPEAESGAGTGYAPGNNIWIGRAGYSKYDRLGNLPAEVGKTAIDLVSLDKTQKNSSTENAQAEIDRGSIYGYWIISLPDENVLDGVVYEKGVDNERKPVKKGTLYFERVGPGPSKNAVEVIVNKSGQYKSDGELTAGHYKVSFDAKDGKGKKSLTENWLYIPGNSPTKDWTVLLRQTYQIIYDYTHTNASDKAKIYDVHMEWHDIPIDWDVQSEESLEISRQLSYMGMYCLTYQYFDDHPLLSGDAQGTESEDEDAIIPGYEPITLNESAPASGDGTLKITQTPTLSFFRGDKGGPYKEDATYINLTYTVSLVVQGNLLEAPVSFELTPLPYKTEEMFQKQGWGILSRIGRLDDKALEALIEDGEPLIISYQDDPPTTKQVKVVIKPEE